MSSRMNDRETWHRLLLTLPDGRFFDIMRNYLGKIKTPFHKPELISRLTSFFLREETQQRVLDSLSTSDIRVLTAVDFLGAPEPRQLFTLLAETEDTFSLHHRLLNLEYRLLILTDTAGPVPVLRCNPLLEKRLKREAVDLACLFSSVPLDRGETGVSGETPPWLQETLVTAFLSYVGDRPECLRADGSVKKRRDRELRELFPFLFDTTRLGRKIDILLTSCAAAGFIEIDTSAVHVLWENCAAFYEVGRIDRLCYRWTAAAPRRPGRDPQRAAMLKKLIYTVPQGALFSETSIRRLIDAIILKEGGQENGYSSFFELCTALGIFIDTGRGFCRTSSLFVPEETEQSGNTYIIQQNMHITVKPEIPFPAALTIARLAEIRKYDIYSEYEITKASFNRFTRTGGESETVFSSFFPPETLPKNVSIILREWEDEYNKVGLYEGIVLTVHKSLRHLVEHNPAVQKYIQAAPAPGVYIFTGDDYPKWSEALAHAGIEHIPAPAGSAKSIQEKERSGFLELPDVENKFPTLPPPGTEERKRTGEDVLREELYEHLNGMKVSKDVYEELKARIEKGFILFAEQLCSETRLERKPAEAKGIDFIGKIRLIEQAIASGKDVLELIERTVSGEPHRCIVTPVKLDKSGETLILQGKELPRGEMVAIEVRKLSLVRKLESVLFTP
jgi:hypothetical protein